MNHIIAGGAGFIGLNLAEKLLENRNDRIVKTKFLIANAYESAEKLKEAYNIYYSILGEYPNSEVIENRLKSLYERRVSRKR